MEILGLIFIIVIFIVLADYYGTGTDGLSNYQIDKFNKQQIEFAKMKWREEVEYKLQNNIINEIPFNPIHHSSLNDDDSKWEEEMKRKFPALIK